MVVGMTGLWFLSLVLFCLLPAAAEAGILPESAPLPESACHRAIAALETAPDAGTKPPPRLLSAIARVESGRPGIAASWPWTINADGKEYYFASKEEAIAQVRRLRAQGVSSIDVGCMQVNLHYHPEAFDSLETAFDPAANVRYAAQFLWNLHQETGSWEDAIGRYNTGDPVRGRQYRMLVEAAGATGLPAGNAHILSFSQPDFADAFRRAAAAQQASKSAHPRRIVIIGNRQF